MITINLILREDHNYCSKIKQEGRIILKIIMSKNLPGIHNQKSLINNNIMMKICINLLKFNINRNKEIVSPISKDKN